MPRFILKVAKDEDDDNIVNMADVKTIFKDLDNDGDGNVELDEFLVNKISVWETETFWLRLTLKYSQTCLNDGRGSLLF